MARFQKIPHKERMRHIKYRDKQWDKDTEKHERDLIRQMIADKEAAMRREAQPHTTDKDREAMEVFRRFGILGGAEGVN